MALKVGGADASGIYVGGSLATAMYVGATQVWAPASGARPTFVQSGSTTVWNAGVPTVPITLTAGNTLIYAHCSNNNTGAITGITGAGATWTSLVLAQTAISSARQIDAWIGVGVSAGAGQTITVSGGPLITSLNMIFMEFSPCQLVTGVTDIGDQASTTSHLCGATGITNATPGLAFGGLRSNNLADYVGPTAGWTDIYSNVGVVRELFQVIDAPSGVSAEQAPLVTGSNRNTTGFVCLLEST